MQPSTRIGQPIPAPSPITVRPVPALEAPAARPAALPLVGYVLSSSRFGWALYALGLVAYGMLLMAFFPTIRDSGDMRKALEAYPKEMLAAFGVTDVMAMSTLPGFLAAEYFSLMWVLILAAFAIASGSGAIAREVETGTMALLLSSPLPRWRILAAKVGAFALQLAGLIVATMLGIAAAGPLVGVDVPPAGLVAVGVLGFTFILVIGGYATLLSALSSDRGRAAMLAVGLTLVFYLMQVVANLSADARWLLDATIFGLYDPRAAMADEFVPWSAVARLAAIAAALYGAALSVFARRDCAVG